MTTESITELSVLTLNTYVAFFLRIAFWLWNMSHWNIRFSLNAPHEWDDANDCVLRHNCTFFQIC